VVSLELMTSSLRCSCIRRGLLFLAAWCLQISQQATSSRCVQPVHAERLAGTLRSFLKGAEAHKVRTWAPAVLTKLLSESEAESLQDELWGPAGEWSRTTDLPREDVGLSKSRAQMDQLARETHAAAVGHGNGDRSAGNKRMSCADVKLMHRSDRRMLAKDSGLQLRISSSQVPEVRLWNQMLFSDGRAQSGFGPTPEGMPCLARFQEALESTPFRTALAELAGLSLDAVQVLHLRVYQHTAWHHYTCPHTDQNFDLIYKHIDNRVVGRWTASNRISMGFNFGNDDPAEAPGGLLWCFPAPHLLPSPLGSAFVFKVSNISGHAILPNHLHDDSRQRLTVQVTFGGPMPGGGSLPSGFGWGGRIGGSEAVEAGILDIERSDRKAACTGKDDDDFVAQLTLAQLGQALTCSALLVDSEMFKLCYEGQEFATRCCASCEEVRSRRALALLDIRPQQMAVASMLRLGNERFKSPSLHGIPGDRQMPLLAFGTGGIKGTRATDLIEYVLRSGYRHLDSALSYPSHTDGSFARGVARSGVPREELFLTTKVPTDSMGFSMARAALKKVREELPGGFADLCLVHWPRSDTKATLVNHEWQVVERAGTWRAFEEAHDRGLCRAIGVSNYMLKHLRELARYARIQPAVNQIEYAPGAPLGELVEHCRSSGIVLEAFAWLLPHNLEQPGLRHVAARLGRPPVLVLMRWFLQQGMVPLWKTDREERVLENTEALSDAFELSPADLDAIAGPTRNDYPWSYYKGDAAPGHVATMDFTA